MSETEGVRRQMTEDRNADVGGRLAADLGIEKLQSEIRKNKNVIQNTVHAILNLDTEKSIF